VDHDLAQVAERLVMDFGAQIPVTTIIAVLRECAAKNPGQTPNSIEQAARAQLRIHRQHHPQ
jgi:hypothetical protein